MQMQMQYCFCTWNYHVDSFILQEQTPTDLVDPSRQDDFYLYPSIPATLCARYVGSGVCPGAWTW
jgi:hypothetical protein